MKRFVLFATMSLALSVAVGAMAAGDRSYQLTDGNHGMVYGGSDMAKASRDTLFLFGGPNSLLGKFQDASGNANWNGWTTQDITYTGVQNWNIDNFNVPAGGGQLAMWCGQRDYPNLCGDGYGNNFNENLVFTYTVANPNINTSVNLQCIFNSDSEPGFDYLRIQYNAGGAWQDIVGPYDAVRIGIVVNSNVSFTPGDYVGPGGNQLQLRFVGFSDGAWSDEDCLYDSAGLAQVDNIVVTVAGGPPPFSENFEDGISQDWVQIFNDGVGDYAKIWSGLQDIDPCAINSTAQVAFVDDGVVVPGTGGYPCVTWCYGPGGYVVNPVGGLAGPASHIDNLLISPILTWPTGYDGAVLTFDVYHHEDLVVGVSPGMFYQWHVRSVDSPNQNDVTTQAWEDRNFVYYARGTYINQSQSVTDLLAPGRDWVQIGLRCIEYGWVFGYEGVDGTPAPYFDNAALRVYPFNSPSIAARDIDLANDNFPERGIIDLATLANNWIRFDAAQNISPDADLRNDPGDSIWVDIGLPRAGSVFPEMPKMFVKMKANPLFNGVRQLPPNFTQNGNLIDGWVYGDSTRGANNTIIANRYNFDLPDSTFFFPGDIIHYYIEAKDFLSGGNPETGTITLPADITGIDNFGGVWPYNGNSTFIVRGLPTLLNAAGNTPDILFWNDFANRGGENEWYFALNNLGYAEHVDYDVFYTNGPSSGVGNGIGGRATAQTLGGYDTLLYTSGDLGAFTISNNDYGNDPSNDIGVLGNWFQTLGKKGFFTGDDLMFNLGTSGGAALAFRNTYFSVRFINGNILPLINNQTAPVVKPVVGNGVFSTAEWIAYGGCPGINDFDAIEPTGSAVRLAQFMTPAGVPGYSYSAMSRYTGVADVIYAPYDFMFIYNTPGYVPSQPGYSARTEVLRDVLIAFGKAPQSPVIDVPNGDMVFGVSNYPNPFNPATEIKMTLPQAGHVSLKVFNVRGELVRTLVNGEMAAGVQKITWNGTSDSGRQVASGVYFYETKYNGETSISKMALVK